MSNMDLGFLHYSNMQKIAYFFVKNIEQMCIHIVGLYVCTGLFTIAVFKMGHDTLGIIIDMIYP